MNRNKKACNCCNVTYGEIVDAVFDGCTTFEQVSERTGCSKGCGKCKDFLAHMVADVQRYPEEYKEQA